MARSFSLNRDKSHYPCVERVHCIFMAPVFVLFVLIILLAILIGVFAGPRVRVPPHQFDYSGQYSRSFLAGNSTITAKLSGMNPLNQVVFIALRLKRSADFGVYKRDFRYMVSFYGERGSDQYLLQSHPEVIHRSYLTCREDANEDLCDPLFIAYEPVVLYSAYEVSITIVDSGALIHNDADKHLLQDFVRIEFSHYDSAFTRFEIGWRYTFVFLSIPFALFFIIYSLCLNKLLRWQTEQVWIAILLVLLILYNNPFFALELTDPTFLLSSLNAIFVTTFICFLMLTVLIITHATIKKPEDRTFLSFFLPKFILIFGTWIMVVLFLLYMIVRSWSDPVYSAYDDISGDYPFFTFVGVAIIVSFVIYFFMLAYYVFRAVGMCCRRRLHSNRNHKFWVILLFTFVVVVCSALDIALIIFRGLESSAQFLIFFVMYNLYTFFIAIFYLPTLKVKEKETVVQEEEGLVIEEEQMYDIMEEEED